MYGHKTESFGRLSAFSRLTTEDRNKPPTSVGGSWSINYNGTWYSIHKLIKGKLKEFRHATLDGLINKIENPASPIENWTEYCINDMTAAYQTRQIAEILANCTYPVFLTNDEDRIDKLTAEQQEYLENKTNHIYHCNNCHYQSNDDRVAAMNIVQLGQMKQEGVKKPSFKTYD